ncbi:MAG: ttuD [Anaerolineales bacterium]|nr:ttuD [Anaerolineales bacterium]
MAPRRTLLASHAHAIWRAGVAAADPLPLMQPVLRLDGEALVLGTRRIPLADIDSIAVIGAGKAGARMSQAVETILGARWLREKTVHGWVNVPADAVRPLRAIHLHAARRSHENRPTRQGLVGTRRIVSLLGQQGRRDLTLCLISGGGSALLPGPAAGVRLGDKTEVTDRLHAAGAAIDEVNTVRKHLSRVKGGGLLRAWRGRWLTSFVLSDVLEDALDVIASGPTSPDPTTFADAIEVLRRYAVWDRASQSVRQCLLEGQAGQRPETLKRLPAGAQNILIGGNRNALDGADREARRLGYKVLDVSSHLRGEASEAGRRLVRLAFEARDAGSTGGQPLCLLGGGETTVRLGSRPGEGGRCQELALAAVFEGQKDDWTGIALLCAGTDGEDGPTDAAGAVVDEDLLRRARRQGLDPEAFLVRHDAYNFFDPLAGLIRTGLTGTQTATFPRRWSLR